MTQRIDLLDTSPFLLGPAILVGAIKTQLLLIPQFSAIFGTAIDDYKRNDYSVRDFPALRIYNETGKKDYESWFITGDIIMDVVLPPATRRNLIQQFQDTFASAMLQQFRRPGFFTAVEATVPGLNELGKEFSYNKNLEFKYENEYCPAVQLVANFKIDLRQWDNYLESQNLTKDSPFAETLSDLELIAVAIKALEDDLTTPNLTMNLEITTV